MNTKNILLVVILSLFAHIICAQKVGINTDSPLTTLDVNGDIRVRKDIKLGEAAGTPGSSGSAGYAFTSQGTGKSPVWSSMGAVSVSGYGVTQSIALSDMVGVTYTIPNQASSITSLSEEFLEGSDITDGGIWTEITGLRSEIAPVKANNRVVVNLQTLFHTNQNDIVDAVVVVGVFIDGKLKSVSPISINGSGYTVTLGNLFDTFSNLPPKSDNSSYVIQIATALRYTYAYSGLSGNPASTSYILTVGTSAAYNMTNEMSMTSLKIDVYEEF